MSTASPTPAPTIEEGAKRDCLVGGAIKVGVVTEECCAVLNEGAPQVVLGNIDIAEFANMNKNEVCGDDDCNRAAVEALMINPTGEQYMIPFEGACEGFDVELTPMCKVTDPDHPEGIFVGHTEVECCATVQELITEFFEGTLLESPVDRASKRTCGGTCGGVIQNALAAAESWYGQEGYLKPYKDACMALTSCELGMDTDISFVTSQYCCASVQAHVSSVLADSSSDTRYFASSETCSNKWGCLDFYVVVLGGAETDLDLDDMLAPFVSSCTWYDSDDGGDGFIGSYHGECKDSTTYLDPVVGKTCKEWASMSCYGDNGLSEEQKMFLQTKCPLSCNVCEFEISINPDAPVPMSYGTALETFCNAYETSVDCSDVAVSGPCFTWFDGFITDGSDDQNDAANSLFSSQCGEPSSNVQDTSWFTDKCASHLKSTVGKCTASSYVEVKFEGSLQIEGAELPEDEEAAAIYVEVLARTIAASVGGGAAVNIVSVNGKLVNSNNRRKLTSDGVVFEVSLAVSCQDEGCSDASAGAEAAISAASTSITEATSSECASNCFTDQMQVASLVVANEIAVAKGIPVSEVISSPAMASASQTLSSGVVTGSTVDTSQAPVVGAVQTGSVVEAIVDQEEESTINEHKQCVTAAASLTPEECVDDDEGMASNSDVAFSTCAAALAFEPNMCSDDSKFVALGAPNHWLGCVCKMTCGHCVGETDAPTVAPTAAPTDGDDNNDDAGNIINAPGSRSVAGFTVVLACIIGFIAGVF
jgi:hypothetical protein